MSPKRPTPQEYVSSLEVLIDFLISERGKERARVNQLNTNHNTVIILLFILLGLVIGAFGCLGLFMLLI